MKIRKALLKGYQKIILWTLKNGPACTFYQKQHFKLSKCNEKPWKENLFCVRFERKI